MEENISENNKATSKIPHSSRMKPLVQTEQFYTQLDEKHQDYETSAEASTNKSKLVKDTTEKTHICNVCGLVYYSEFSLLNHLLVHSNEQISVCKECGRIFIEKRSLVRHLRVHKSEKLFICVVCSKSFIDAASLKSHCQTHTNEKPYACDICSKTFCRRGDLRRHLRIHTKGKPYDCEVCSEAFTDGHTLKRHLRIHTKEKPYRIFNDGGYSKRNAVWGLHKIYSAMQSYLNFHREYLKTALKRAYICTAFGLLDMNPMIFGQSGFTD
ncbi:Zinc finger protein 84 [Araneus ventricosus]|uniref:Zinc finger protein 84 n=1 Tax=Araneus ventricosus TaxID=182803 RepID=A0A4Y2J9H8_ARAVE|nr:Zinc finger protein 84 [Araneus ventricosus]